MKLSFKNLYHSNLIISTASTSLYLYYSFISNINISLYIVNIVFFGTYIVYHLQRLGQYHFHLSLNDDLKQFYQTYRYRIFITTLVAFISIFFSLNQLDLKEVSLLTLSFIISLLYIKIPFSSISLRHLPYAKAICIALVWSLVCSQLANINMVNGLDAFFFILLLCIPFDIKDFLDDQKENIITFASANMQKLKKTLSLLSILYALFGIAYYQEVFFIIFPIFYCYVIWSKIEDWKYYIVLDGLIILRFFMYLYQN